MKILVTGSAGRVGRAIYIRLMKHCKVKGIDVVPASSVDYLGSITDNSFLETITEQFDVIVHSAALHAPHVNVRSNREFIATNVMATKKLARWGQRRGIKQLIFLSTTAVYGYASTKPGQCNWITEDTVPKPRTIYHTTKLKAESWLTRFASTSGIPVTVLRMSRCFPEPAHQMAVYRLHRGVDMRDVASACFAAAKTRLPGFQLFNISSNTPFNPDDCALLYQDAERLIRQREPRLAQIFESRGWQFPQRIDRVYDSGKAQRLLNWQPNYGFEAVLNWLDDEVPEVLPVACENRLTGIVEE